MCMCVKCGPAPPERVGQLQGKETTPGRHLSITKADSQKKMQHITLKKKNIQIPTTC